MKRPAIELKMNDGGYLLHLIYVQFGRSFETPATHNLHFLPPWKIEFDATRAEHIVGVCRQALIKHD